MSTAVQNTVTEFSPYYLMFVRTPKLPIDLYSGTQIDDLSAETHTKYTQQRIAIGIQGSTGSK